MNKQILTCCLIVIVSLLFSSSELTASSNIIELNIPILKENTSNFAPNEVIVTFKDDVDFNESAYNNGVTPLTYENKFDTKFMGELKNKIDSALSGTTPSMKFFHNLGATHFKVPEKSAEELIALFNGPDLSSYIECVSKNYIMTLVSTNDPYYDKLWAIENSGQEVNYKEGVPDADMDINEAWDISDGDENIIVAILDTGVDYTHSDLSDNMWRGLAKHGLDFAANDNGDNDDDPMPDEPYNENGHYHGTHVAGIIGAVGNNSIGISGVAQNVQIMALKVFRPNGYGYSSDIMEALDYVSQRVDAGDNIVAINASYGGGGTQGDSTSRAIESLGDKGVVFCAAAGNSSLNIDNDPVYPASYDAPNIIAIAASDQDDNLASFSNYGKNSVDIAAPGTNILSTYPENRYAYLQGTSMATPNIVGSIVLLAAQNPNASAVELKNKLLDGVDVKPIFTDKTVTDGRVNTYIALGGIVNIIPDYIPTLKLQGSIITGAQGTIDIVVRVGEFESATNSQGDLMFSITKNENLILDFDPTETTQQGETMQNSLWSLNETASLYIFTYTGNNKLFPASSLSRVGLTGTFNSPNSSKGQFSLDTTMSGGTGEENLSNNRDSEIIEYNNLTGS